jgi:hypothetical protein
MSGIHQVLLGGSNSAWGTIPAFMATTGAVISGGTSVAKFRLVSQSPVNTVTWQRTLFGTYDTPELVWKNVNSSNFEVRGIWNPITGSGTTGGVPDNTWVDFSVDREWTFTSTNTDGDYDLQLDIRPVYPLGGGTYFASLITFATFGSP